MSPATGSDPLHRLSRAASRVDVGPYTLIVPWYPAQVWFAALSGGLEGCALALADDPDEVAIALACQEITFQDVSKASQELVEAATGRRWWVALRLVLTGASGAVLGELTLSGVDPERVSLSAWCEAVYRVMTRNADDKARMKTDFELELPPPGHEDAWDDGNNYDDLVALARQYAS